MPPKKRATKGKCEEAKKKTNRVPHEPEAQPSMEGAESQREEQDHEADAEDDDEYPAVQRIVEFYETHPYLYNLRHEKYRNTKLKEAELAELAKEIKWTVEKIKRRFKNLRGTYGKLKNRAGSAGKSGQSSCRLTTRQEWKLRNLAFLDEVIQPRSKGQELGRMLQFAGEDDDDVEAREDFVPPDNEDEDIGAEGRKRGSSADSQDSASKRKKNMAGTSTSMRNSSKKKSAKNTPDVGEVLTEMLLENRRRDREMEKQLLESGTSEPDEREAWGSWLKTVVHNCPKEKFRQFQMETLAMSHRYQPTYEGHRTSGQQCPAPPPAPPAMFPPQPAAFQFPVQFQHPSQQFHCQPQFQQQEMQQPGYMRQPTVTNLLHQQQHQATRTTSAPPTTVGTSDIIARSYEIANKDDGTVDFISALRNPALGDRLGLFGFSAGSFDIHGTSGDQPVVPAIINDQFQSDAE